MFHGLRSSAFSGYRVAFLTDFHLAPWQSSRFIASSVDVANSWAPDLVALGGDYGYSVRPIPPLSRACYRNVIPRVARELSRLRARDGVFAVLGNHDIDGGAQSVEKALASIGFRVLRNEAHHVTRGDHALEIVGGDDPKHGFARGARLGQLHAGQVDATLILSHHPDALLALGEFGTDDRTLIVAGHTHGGQITFPGIGAPITLSHVATHRFPAGFIPNELTALYVSRGLGEQMPLRIGADREITLLELVER